MQNILIDHWDSGADLGGGRPGSGPLLAEHLPFFTMPEHTKTRLPATIMLKKILLRRLFMIIFFI